jgi:protein arginine kinase
MDFNELQSKAGEWLGGSGPESDIVISSRIRLARNIAEFPFLSRANPKERGQLEKTLREQILETKVSEGLSYFSLPALSQVDRLFLVERHLISREHAFGKGPRGVAIGPLETISIMVNEEDHLRLQALRSGLQLRKTWEEINLVDDRLERGGGLRLLLAVRLPDGLSDERGHGDAGFGHAAPAGAGDDPTDREGLPGGVEDQPGGAGPLRGGHPGLGGFLPDLESADPGKTEIDIISNIESVIPKIVEYERTVRETLIENKREIVEGQGVAGLRHAEDGPDHQLRGDDGPPLGGADGRQPPADPGPGDADRERAFHLHPAGASPEAGTLGTEFARAGHHPGDLYPEPAEREAAAMTSPPVRRR